MDLFIQLHCSENSVTVVVTIAVIVIAAVIKVLKEVVGQAMVLEMVVIHVI